MSVNKVILLGNLGGDVTLRETGNGNNVANFTMATNEKWTDKQGQKQERTEWHNVVAWGRTGELCAQYLSKGRQACVEGRIQTRKWQGKDGTDKYTTEIVASAVHFIGGGGGQRNNDAVAPLGEEVPF